MRLGRTTKLKTSTHMKSKAIRSIHGSEIFMIPMLFKKYVWILQPTVV
jgi:hypothetical protein